MKHPVTILQQTEKTIVGATWRGIEANDADPYTGFSVCHYTGDEPSHYQWCRQQLASLFGLSSESVIVPRQIHGTNVAVIDSVDFERTEVENVDAVIVTVPRLIVGVCTADCIPVIITCEEPTIVAAVHAGWRGAVAGIVEKTVEIMRRHGARDLCAVIGAGIGVCCFEVGDEVASQFPEEFVDRSFGERPHVDLKGYVASCLRNSGVTSIADIEECTRCAPDRYFSARAQGINSGRNYTFAMIKSE